MRLRSYKLSVNKPSVAEGHRSDVTSGMVSRSHSTAVESCTHGQLLSDQEARARQRRDKNAPCWPAVKSSSLFTTLTPQRGMTIAISHHYQDRSTAHSRVLASMGKNAAAGSTFPRRHARSRLLARISRLDQVSVSRQRRRKRVLLTVSSIDFDSCSTRRTSRLGEYE